MPFPGTAAPEYHADYLSLAWWVAAVYIVGAVIALYFCIFFDYLIDPVSQVSAATLPVSSGHLRGPGGRGRTSPFWGDCATG